MLFLSILIILNAVLNNVDFVNTYRLELGGLPLNIFDILIVLGVLIALLRPRSSAGFFRTDKTHPVLWWMLALFVLGFLGGMMGAASNGAASRNVITTMRNYLAAPAAAYLAYFLTSNFKSGKWFLYAMVIAGVGVSLMTVLFFREKTETVRNVISIRAVMYISMYAGLAMVLLVYTLSVNLRLFPVVLTVLLIGVCLMGQFITLSRSDWLACFFALAATVMLMPRERRMKSVVRMALAVPVLVVSLMVGLQLASKATGKNMFEKMEERLYSMLPGDRPGVKAKAWDTRLPGTLKELRMWRESPILGRGFGIHDTWEAEPQIYSGLRHNSWSSTLAETGIFGFAAFALMTGACFICGLRILRDGGDKYTLLVGMLGAVTAVYATVHGFATMSFNQVRWGLPLFITTGVILRLRAIQLTQMRLAADEQAYWEQNPDLWAATAQAQQDPQYGYDEPVFGNWYQPN